ncbi:formyltetrahydrofolate deformylase [Rhodoblastus sphagnicola]|uniref:Formyltetrahydrofolate deformylase n=1 Tax=Rhodoblastus sphagnicola TaxID=333368 RepID=A0A2S6N7X0_9HYPH|nr:formyltetrahydrofolate deformylase [Rhodoblastus sphagnicola]MBB4197829.1 formyltetrahydrofolate deformylase [Rhodoblastus sphagnicola]PPQ30708.1 formyltetrahydrofolate deformylase [Rhodoblastus sphagnicola]
MSKHKPANKSAPAAPPVEIYYLLLTCPNRPGIIARVASHIFECGFNIADTRQFDEEDTDRFFMRVEFNPVREGADIEAWKASFSVLADEYDMTWRVRAQSQLSKVLILVSKFDHCLADLLYRWRIGELPMEIVGVASNYPRETFPHLDFDGIPFHYLPVTRETKMEQEAQIWALVQQSHADLLVLARYMQILSDGLAAKLVGRCINIHHSFLPGFKGARPYHQAHARGVKVIGASAHYVTAELDEGPIIEQDVERISHHHRPDDLVSKGRDIERRVLARAVRYHVENRVVINGRKTIVFTE